MKKAVALLLPLAFVLLLIACGNNVTPIDESNDAEASETVPSVVPDEKGSQPTVVDIADYEKILSFPEKGGSYEYYSYGYHCSTVTIMDYTYKVAEQSSEKIRIDFDFSCRADYLGENTAGTSFCFLIGVYKKTGEKIDDVIVDVQGGSVGDTIAESYTLLLEKSDIVDGIQLKFEGNKPAEAENS